MLKSALLHGFRWNRTDASRILCNLWLSSFPASQNKHWIQQNQIGAIVNLAGRDKVANAFQHPAPDGCRVEYLAFDIPDLPTHADTMRGILNHTTPFIRQAHANGKNVLVHCHARISRSATVVLAYLVSEHKMALREAMLLVKAKRDCVNPNSGFLRVLVDYERQHLGYNSPLWDDFHEWM